MQGCKTIRNQNTTVIISLPLRSHYFLCLKNILKIIESKPVNFGYRSAAHCIGLTLLSNDELK